MLLKALLHGGLRDGGGRFEAFELKSDGRKGGHTYDGNLCLVLCVSYLLAFYGPFSVLLLVWSCFSLLKPAQNSKINFEFRDESAFFFLTAESLSVMPGSPASENFLFFSVGLSFEDLNTSVWWSSLSSGQSVIDSWASVNEEEKCSSSRACGSAPRCAATTSSLGENSNVQEGSVLHTDQGFPLTIRNNVTVGHMVMLHGCDIVDGSLALDPPFQRRENREGVEELSLKNVH
jgi:hypothetical protein